MGLEDSGSSRLQPHPETPVICPRSGSRRAHGGREGGRCCRCGEALPAPGPRPSGQAGSGAHRRGGAAGGLHPSVWGDGPSAPLSPVPIRQARLQVCGPVCLQTVRTGLTALVQQRRGWKARGASRPIVHARTGLRSGGPELSVPAPSGPQKGTTSGVGQGLSSPAAPLRAFCWNWFPERTPDKTVAPFVTYLTPESVSLKKLHFRTFPLTCCAQTRLVMGSVPLVHDVAAVPGGESRAASCFWHRSLPSQCQT